MKHILPGHQLARLSEFIEAQLALHFPPPRWGELEAGVGVAAKLLGYPDAAAFSQELMSSPVTEERKEILAGQLTTSETYFWREPRVFDALEGSILPGLIQGKEAQGNRILRLWCAGCSSGDEAYSIAIALRRGLPTVDNWNITILATDINPSTLRKAELGTYGEWSFRNAPDWLTADYFLDAGRKKRTVIPAVRSMVMFSYLNLADGMYPSTLNDTTAMDIIFCRNVLMYFTPDRARWIVERMGLSLVDGGWMIPAACECSQVLFRGFEVVSFPEATAYRKGMPGTATPPHMAPAAVHPKPLAKTPLKHPATEHHRSAGKNSRDREKPKTKAVTAAIPASTTGPVGMPARPLPESTPLEELSVQELADAGHLDEALALCRTLISNDRVNARFHFLEAAILQELNRDAEATASLKKALYLDPQSLVASFMLGNLALRTGDRPTGIRWLRNTLTLLAQWPDDEILPEAGGLTVGRFRELLSATMRKHAPLGSTQRYYMEVP